MKDRSSRYAVESLEPRFLLTAAPDLAWSSYLGGTANDHGNDLAIDGSGSAWVPGTTSSSGWAVGGFDTSYNGGTSDAFVSKINANGTLAWSTYLGGTDSETAYRVAIDGAGNAWVTGQTSSSGWAVGGFDTSHNGSTDAFIAKINPDGTLAWSSYLGGTGSEYGYGMAIDGSGNAWVTGFTSSTDLAVGGFDATFNGGFYDAFIAKINANGTLAWSSYLGGASSDTGRGIAVDNSGNAWVAGETASSGWAVGGFDTSHNGVVDAFFAKINADGTLAWSSYLGGTLEDGVFQIAIDNSGNAWATGFTRSGGWVEGGFDTSHNGGYDAFISKVNANGTLAWSSYLGGPNADDGEDIAIDGSGNAWVAGYTASPGWTVGGFDNSHNGSNDALVAKVNADGTLAWSSYLGGTTSDFAWGIAVDNSDNAWVTGQTTGSGWTVGGFDTSHNGVRDAFVAKVTNTDVTPPVVSAASYFYATAPNSVRLTFTEDVSSSLSATDLIVTAVPGGTPVSVTNFAYDSVTNTATFTLLTPLADGNYRARLPADSVSDPAGHPLAADYTFDFLFLRGDANGDGRVNLNDFNILAANFGQSPRDFTQGDFDYSGNVNLSDFNILAGRFGTVLPGPGSIARGELAVSSTAQSLTFGTVSIADSKDDLLDDLLA